MIPPLISAIVMPADFSHLFQQGGEIIHNISVMEPQIEFFRKLPSQCHTAINELDTYLLTHFSLAHSFNF